MPLAFLLLTRSGALISFVDSCWDSSPSMYPYWLETTNSWNISDPRESFQRRSILSDPLELRSSTMGSQYKLYPSTPLSPPMYRWLGCICDSLALFSLGNRVLIYIFFSWPPIQRVMRGSSKIRRSFSYRHQLGRIRQCYRKIRRLRHRET